MVMSETAHNCLRLAALFIFVGALFVVGVRCEQEAPQRNLQPRTPTVNVLVDAPGAGAEATDGKMVAVQYNVTLPSGEEILNSRDKGRPETWRIGEGSVITGMDQAVLGMRTGGKRTVRIPPALHWGSNGYGDVVSPNVSLTFEIELIEVY